MRYLLDTNTCIHALKGVESVVDAMAARRPSDLAVSTVTSYELHTGVQKCADPQRERTKVDTFFGTIPQIAFDAAAAIEAATIRARLESRGEMIGPYDALIAGHATSLGMTLVTDNTAEFARVEGLAIEDWKSAST